MVANEPAHPVRQVDHIVGIVADRDPLAGQLVDEGGVNDIGSGAWTGLIAITMLNIVAGVLLSIGTVMLLLRKMTSRWIVVAGCAVSIVSSLISLSLASTVAEYQYGGKGADVVGLIFPIVTIVMALLPSSTAWIEAKQKGVPHPPHWG